MNNGCEKCVTNDRFRIQLFTPSEGNENVLVQSWMTNSQTNTISGVGTFKHPLKNVLKGFNQELVQVLNFLQITKPNVHRPTIGVEPTHALFVLITKFDVLSDVASDLLQGT